MINNYQEKQKKYKLAQIQINVKKLNFNSKS